jgi:hypothetical protein
MISHAHPATYPEEVESPHYTEDAVPGGSEWRCSSHPSPSKEPGVKESATDMRKTRGDLLDQRSGH